MLKRLKFATRVQMCQSRGRQGLSRTGGSFTNRKTESRSAMVQAPLCQPERSPLDATLYTGRSQSAVADCKNDCENNGMCKINRSIADCRLPIALYTATAEGLSCIRQRVTVAPDRELAGAIALALQERPDDRPGTPC